jgi:deoxyribodipyrimidine photo-lyase
VPETFIHAPWEMPDDVQRGVGCIIGADYPAPIVDHTAARQRVLAAYRQGEKG